MNEFYVFHNTLEQDYATTLEYVHVLARSLRQEGVCIRLVHCQIKKLSAQILSFFMPILFANSAR